jgi:SDR family mycofactocin-dependent oxidoreductase
MPDTGFGKVGTPPDTSVRYSSHLLGTNIEKGKIAMAGRLEGKVAFITGAARGQGRSHAIRLAEEGADIIAIDLCDQMDSVAYPQGTAEELAETVAMVEALDRRIVSRKADVRERDQLRAAVAAGIAELGHLDIVVCNAGILPIKHKDPSAFIDAMDVDLVGVLNTVAVSLPHLSAGASIVITGSTAGLMPNAVNNPVLGPGGSGYGLAKTLLVQYTEALALNLAPSSIRANCIHPTNCDTNLLHNDELNKIFRPDLENPTKEDTLPAHTYFQGMPIPYVDPRDISNAVLFLASDEARYITGIQLRVDAASLLKWPNGPA